MEEPAASANPLASRQKNCNSCVQAKRRCDRRTPICSRCSQKRTPCVYTKPKPFSRSVQQEVEPSGHMERPSLQSPACSFFAPGLTFDVDYLGVIPLDSQPNTATAAATTEEAHNYRLMDVDGNIDVPVNSFMDLMGNDSTPTGDQLLAHVDHGSGSERPSTPADEEIVADYQRMAQFCVSSVSLTSVCHILLSFPTVPYIPLDTFFFCLIASG